MENKSTIPPMLSLRKAAERHISRTLNNTPKLPVEKLQHELNVHQVELEMQNEALQQTQQALEETLNRYVSLYEFAPVGYLTLNNHGVIDEANLTSVDLFGENRNMILKQNLSHFIVPEDSDRWHLHLSGILQQKINKSCELKMHRADGSTFDAKLDCLLLEPQINHTSQDRTKAPIFNKSKLMVRIAVSDITEMKLAEQELRIAATVFESHEGMMVTDANNLILKVNKAFTSISGYTMADVVGKTPQIFSSGRHDKDFFNAMWTTINSTGAWQGEIWNRRKNGVIFPQWLTITAVKDKSGATTHYVATITDITERKATEEAMQMLAFYDPLTLLPNRRLLLDRLQRAISNSVRTRQYCALMFVDLDKFKDLNDSLGHNVGDLMLQNVAQRLVNCVREGDTVSRLGGDEFMVMLENLKSNLQESASLAQTIGSKIIDAINQPCHLDGHVCCISASIGVTLFVNHRYSASELQKQADIAMYQAKASGRNILRFFNTDLNADLSAN